MSCATATRSVLGGKGVGKAVENVRTVISKALQGRDPTRQVEIDRAMIELDGTPNKSKLGANATVGVSMAVARAAAQALACRFTSILGGTTARRLPVPMMNIINGGKHAGTKLEFQEFMIVPHGRVEFCRGDPLWRRNLSKPEVRCCTPRDSRPVSAMKAVFAPSSKAMHRPAS